MQLFAHSFLPLGGSGEDIKGKRKATWVKIKEHLCRQHKRRGNNSKDNNKASDMQCTDYHCHAKLHHSAV